MKDISEPAKYEINFREYIAYKVGKIRNVLRQVKKYTSPVEIYQILLVL